jgi:hypothetical protein
MNLDEAISSLGEQQSLSPSFGEDKFSPEVLEGMVSRKAPLTLLAKLKDFVTRPAGIAPKNSDTIFTKSDFDILSNHLQKLGKTGEKIPTKTLSEYAAELESPVLKKYIQEAGPDASHMRIRLMRSLDEGGANARMYSERFRPKSGVYRSPELQYGTRFLNEPKDNIIHELKHFDQFSNGFSRLLNALLPYGYRPIEIAARAAGREGESHLGSLARELRNAPLHSPVATATGAGVAAGTGIGYGLNDYFSRIHR